MDAIARLETDQRLKADSEARHRADWLAGWPKVMVPEPLAGNLHVNAR